MDQERNNQKQQAAGDGSRFLFCPPNGILGGLLLTTDSAIIEKQLASISAVRGL